MSRGDGSFASNCLLARRLVERGVRFVQLYHRGSVNHHGGVKKGTAATAELVDQGTAALIRDLKQRGLLEDTLLIWGGEFGRTPMAQGSGRDHHIMGFSMFLAGGGVRGGMTYGATDELGYNAEQDPVHVRGSACDDAAPARDRSRTALDQVPGFGLHRLTGVVSMRGWLKKFLVDRLIG